jgi:hypothetical protein
MKPTYVATHVLNKARDKIAKKNWEEPGRW